VARTCVLTLAALVGVALPAVAQDPAGPRPALTQRAAAQAPAVDTKPPVPPSSPAAPVNQDVPAGIPLPPGYVIGLQDVFDVIVWKDDDMTTKDVVVRPDGKISLPLIHDVPVEGLTVDELRTKLTTLIDKAGVEDPRVSIVVKGINSRKVTVTGPGIAKQGQYALLSRMTVVDLLSVAGGVQEYGKPKGIFITRMEGGKQVVLRFNYKMFLEGKPEALERNIELKPGDIVTVP